MKTRERRWRITGSGLTGFQACLRSQEDPTQSAAAPVSAAFLNAHVLRTRGSRGSPLPAPATARLPSAACSCSSSSSTPRVPLGRRPMANHAAPRTAPGPAAAGKATPSACTFAFSSLAHKTAKGGASAVVASGRLCSCAQRQEGPQGEGGQLQAASPSPSAVQQLPASVTFQGRGAC